MRLTRRRWVVLLLAAGLLSACGSTDTTEAGSSATPDMGDAESATGSGEPTEAETLLSQLQDQLDYEFEASVFVLEDGEIEKPAHPIGATRSTRSPRR